MLKYFMKRGKLGVRLLFKLVNGIYTLHKEILETVTQQTSYCMAYVQTSHILILFLQLSYISHVQHYNSIKSLYKK